jgi:hypothetical protein
VLRTCHRASVRGRNETSFDRSHRRIVVINLEEGTAEDYEKGIQNGT